MIFEYTCITLESHGTQVGPKIEFCHGDIFQDEDIVKILPFLALPDGAHLVSTTKHG
jgi:hypothetical protein